LQQTFGERPTYKIHQLLVSFRYQHYLQSIVTLFLRSNLFLQAKKT